jgi:hypothetical protein
MVSLTTQIMKLRCWAAIFAKLEDRKDFDGE